MCCEFKHREQLYSIVHSTRWKTKQNKAKFRISTENPSMLPMSQNLFQELLVWITVVAVSRSSSKSQSSPLTRKQRRRIVLSFFPPFLLVLSVSPFFFYDFLIKKASRELTCTSTSSWLSPVSLKRTLLVCPWPAWWWLSIMVWTCAKTKGVNIHHRPSARSRLCAAKLFA